MSERDRVEVGSREEAAVTCPHCRKTFVPAPLPRPTARHRGYKCPHCRLFVPHERAADAPISRGTGDASRGRVGRGP